MSALDGINFPRRETRSAKCSARWHSREVARTVNLYSGNPSLQIGNPACLIAVQRKAAPPPVAAYDAWLDSLPRFANGKKRTIFGCHIRRAVVMQRDGYNISEIERATGHKVRSWLTKLPPELAA